MQQFDRNIEVKQKLYVQIIWSLHKHRASNGQSDVWRL